MSRREIRPRRAQKQKTYNEDLSESDEAPSSPKKKRSEFKKRPQETKGRVKRKMTEEFDLHFGSFSDDEKELPPVVLHSPAKDATSFEKNEIVWIKYKKFGYRPCLITGVDSKRKIVRFKFVRERKYTFRAPFRNVVKFDDPSRNFKLLEESKKKDMSVVQAFNRVSEFFCRCVERPNLSAKRFLFSDQTKDFLYGIIPDADDESGDESDKNFKNDHHFHHFKNSESDEDREEEGDIDDNMKINPIFKTENCDILSDAEKTELVEKTRMLLSCIECDDCFKYLESVYNGTVPSERMELFKQNKELPLSFKAGFGPFEYAGYEMTDQLLDILEKFLNKLKVSGDQSVFLRYVMMPEATIFAIEKCFQTTKMKAEQFYTLWKLGKADWSFLKDVTSVGNWEVSKSANEDESKSMNEDVPKSSNKDVTESALENIHKSAKEHVPESTDEDVIKSANKDVPESAGKDVTGFAEKEVTKSAKEDAPKLAGDYIFEPTNEDAPVSANEHATVSPQKDHQVCR